MAVQINPVNLISCKVPAAIIQSERRVRIVCRSLDGHKQCSLSGQILFQLQIFPDFSKGGFQVKGKIQPPIFQNILNASRECKCRFPRLKLENERVNPLFSEVCLQLDMIHLFLNFRAGNISFADFKGKIPRLFHKICVRDSKIKSLHPGLHIFGCHFILNRTLHNIKGTDKDVQRKLPLFLFWLFIFFRRRKCIRQVEFALLVYPEISIGLF